MMDWDLIADLAAGACFLLAGFLTVAAGIGMKRFPGLLGSIHAAAKPQGLGVLLSLVGLALRLREIRYLAILILVGLFQLVTTPVSFHVVARAGYRTGKVNPDALVVDELIADLEASAREHNDSD
ncbi:MAG TPA: monovalent cation/H(+) antiporter subunit G [Acidimicrobiia bacterium]|nr:monovalent cation/H(+) antiporter subunit G [Acidimicrobiia bacterium]